jgi:hypothetical protein
VFRLRRPGASVALNYSAGTPEGHRAVSARVQCRRRNEIFLKKCACKNVDFHLPRPSCGRPRISWRMEVHMNDLFSAHWTSTGRKAGEQEIDWLQQPASGFGRLLAAVAIIGVGVCVLDHAAGKGPADSLIASSYDSSR